MSTQRDESRDLHTVLVRAIRRACGLTERYAVPIATQLQRDLREHYGEKLYLSSRTAADRRDEILADFDGENHADVCRQHRISRRTLYRLLQDDAA